MCYGKRLKQRLVVLPTEMTSLYSSSVSIPLSAFLTIFPILFTLPILYTLNGQTQTWNWGTERKKEKKINTKQDVQTPQVQSYRVECLNNQQHQWEKVMVQMDCHVFFTHTHCPGLAKFAYNDRVNLTVVNHQGLSLYLPPTKQLFLPEMVLHT